MDVVLDHFGHKTCHGASRAGNQVQDRTAVRLGLKRALYSLDLSPQPTSTSQQLLLVFDGMHQAYIA